jgi:hypothetical protein
MILFMNALIASRKPIGERSGPGAGLLHSPFYYVFTLGFDFAVGILLWIPMPGTPWAS